MRAIYFDGEHAQRRLAEIEAAEDGIAFQLADGTKQTWPRAGFRTSASPAGNYLVLERGLQSLIIEDPADAARLSALLGHRSGGSLWGKAATYLIPAVALIAVIWATFPILISGIARLMPKSVESRLGNAVYSMLAPPGTRLSGPAVEQPLNRIANRLTKVSEGGYRYQVAITRSRDVNAWAAPGGYIAVYCGLIHQLESGDQLASILAHEFTHVTRRHSTRSLVRNVVLRIGVSFLGGNTDALFDTAGMLGALHLMRGDEEEADSGALDLLVKAQIDPRALAQAFGRLEHGGADLPDALKYLSTHPPTHERAAKAERSARKQQHPARPTLTPEEWRSFKAACKCG